jgi:hypothetical protein
MTEEIIRWGASQCAHFSKYYYGDEIKDDDMGGTNSTSGGNEKIIHFNRKTTCEM